MKIVGIVLLVAVAQLGATTARAAGGRPMTTDDAALTSTRSCQLETWFQHARGDAQLWLLPACNPWQRVELSAGAVLDWPQGASQSTGALFQVKTQWLDAQAAQAGFTAGAQRGQGLWNLYYAYVPVTLNCTRTTQLHVNLGWQRDRVARDDALYYAVAIAHDLSTRYNVFAELFGTDAARPTAQAGGAVLFRDGAVQLDASLGRPLHGSPREFIYSIGVELYPAALW